MKAQPTTAVDSQSAQQRWQDIASLKLPFMPANSLSIEQQLRLEVTFRKIDACDKIDVMKAITKRCLLSKAILHSRHQQDIDQLRRSTTPFLAKRFGIDADQL